MKSSPVGPTLAALRQATASRHQQAEALLALDQPSSLARYRRILQGFDAFLGVWEPAVQAAVPPARRAWLDARSRRHWLAHDLQALDARSPEGLTEELASLGSALQTHGAAFGSLYVVEGSALGGQLICRQVGETLGLTPSNGAAYFHGHGSATGAMWREFREVLESETADGDGARADACTAAVATFDALIAQMKACLA